MEAKRFVWVIGVMVCSILLAGVSSFATSVYTIGHGELWDNYCPFNAFDIVNDQIVFRDSVELLMPFPVIQFRIF